MPNNFKKKNVIPLQKKKPSTSGIKGNGNFKISLQYFDSTQKFSSTFRDWQKSGLLSKALETLQGYCGAPLESQTKTDKFTVYGNFPDKDCTKFKCPSHVPADACWARIHVNGPAIIVGHVVKDTFYVVFLDKTHKFWLTKKERK